MIVKGTPNKAIQKQVRKAGGRRKIITVVSFDENGLAEIDETKFDKTDLSKILKHCTVVDEKESDEDIRQRAKEAGIKSWHVKSIDRLIKELEG